MRGTGSRVDRAQTVHALRELIAALDRRVPQIERIGEIEIARASAELRAAALERIAQLGGDEGSDATGKLR